MDNIIETVNKLKDDEKVQEVVKEVAEKAKDVDIKEVADKAMDILGKK